MNMTVIFSSNRHDNSCWWFTKEAAPRKWGIWAKPFRGCSNGTSVRIGPPIEDEGMAKFSFSVDGVGVDTMGQCLGDDG